MDNDSASLDLLRGLRQWTPLILLCLVVTTAAAFVASKAQRKQYTANASIYFRNAQLDQQAAGLPSFVPANPQSETPTNLKLAALPLIATATAKTVGHGLTGASVQSSVSVTQQGETNLSTVAATSTSPALAAMIANTYSHQIISYRQQIGRRYYDTALRQANLQYRALTAAQKLSQTGADLKDRANSLQILSELVGSGVQLAQPASVPHSPSSPKVTRNTALGGVLGLLLGLALALLLQRFDRRLREPRDLAEVYGVPLIGVIPQSSAFKLRRSAGGKTPSPVVAEMFGLLRARIRYFNVDRELRAVLIVSAEPGEGKTTVARNLALAAAKVGSRVLLVECDLRRPAVARQFGLPASPGISDVLIGGLPLEDAVQRVKLAEPGSDIELDVLVAGGVLSPNPAQMIESPEMTALIDHVKMTYDLVLMDAPPLAAVPDAFPLLRQADGVVVVGRLGRNQRNVAERLRDTLASANAPLIGVVANGYRRRSGSTYGYDGDFVSAPFSAPSGNGAKPAAAARSQPSDQPTPTERR